MILSHKFIVFCGHGSNPLGIIHSLKEAGINPILFVALDCPTSYADKSKFIAAVHYAPTSQDALELMIELYGNEKEYKPFVFTQDDFHAKLIDSNYSRLDGRFFFFNCEQPGVLTKFLNKDEQCRWAEQCGIKTPKREVVERGELPRSLQYPVITKTITSNDGKWKGDSYICSSPQELLDSFKIIEADKLLIEEYIEKQEEVVYHGISAVSGNNREILIPFVQIDRSFSRNGYGKFLYYSKLDGDSDELKKVKRLIQSLHFNGLFEVEFIKGMDDQLYFLEVNLRSSAHNYPITFGGFNMPYEWALVTLGEKRETKDLKDSFYGMEEFGEFFKRVVHSRAISLFDFFSEVRKANVFMWYYRGDLGPFLYFLWKRLGRMFKRRVTC